MPSIKISFAPDKHLEVEASNLEALIDLVNRATRKFFPDTSWASKDF